MHIWIGELKERITRIEEASACLNKIHMEIMCDFEEEKPENFGKEDDGRRIIWSALCMATWSQVTSRHQS